MSLAILVPRQKRASGDEFPCFHWLPAVRVDATRN